MNYDINTKEGMANAKAWTEAHLKCISDGGAWVVHGWCLEAEAFML